MELARVGSDSRTVSASESIEAPAFGGTLVQIESDLHEKAHWARAQAAEELASRVDLADVSALLRDLNEARKSEAYGDVASPDLDASEIASRIEAYVEAVERLLEESGS